MKKEKNKNQYAIKELLNLSDEFDNYDIVDHLNEGEEVDFEVQLTRRHFSLEKSLAEKVAKLSYKRGVSPETYINLILQQKILEEIDS